MAIFNSKSTKTGDSSARRAGSSGGVKRLRGSRGKLPTKRSINLRLEDENAINWKIGIPGILLIVLLAGGFSKVAVVDRLMALSKADGRVTALERELREDYARIDSYAGLKDDYAHYTYSGFSAMELARVDRVKILELVGTYFNSGDISRNWFLSENVLTVEVTGETLEDLNLLAHRVEQDPIVDRCSITNAIKSDQIEKKSGTRSMGSGIPDAPTGVKATFIVYLQQPQ